MVCWTGGEKRIGKTTPEYKLQDERGQSNFPRKRSEKYPIQWKKDRKRNDSKEETTGSKHDEKLTKQARQSKRGAGRNGILAMKSDTP